MARATVLLLVADPVVRDTKTRAEDVLKERPEPNIEVVGHDMRVALDVRPHDPLSGPVVAREVVRKPWEVPLEVVPLYICAA